VASVVASDGEAEPLVERHRRLEDARREDRRRPPHPDHRRRLLPGGHPTRAGGKFAMRSHIMGRTGR